MDLTLWKEAKKRNKMTIADIAEKAGLPKGTVQNIFAGYVPSPRYDTVEAIERALGLQNGPKQLSEGPRSEIAENFVRDNFDLIQEKDFNDLTKLYRVMTIPQRMQALAYIVGFLTHAGVNTQAIVGY